MMTPLVANVTDKLSSCTLQAAQIDFDDMQAGGDVVPSDGGFLARLSSSVSGAFGSVFTS